MSVYVEKNKKTKRLIQTSFLKMLEHKPFDTITVNDITSEAGINRGTFYLHYLDKFDLLEQIEEQLFSEIGEHIDELQKNYTFGTTFEDHQQQLATALFGSIKLQAPYLKIFLGERGRAGFHMRFKQAFSSKVEANMKTISEIEEHLKVPFPYFLSFITSAFLGLIEQWVQEDLKSTPEEMTKIYIGIIQFIQKEK